MWAHPYKSLRHLQNIPNNWFEKEFAHRAGKNEVLRACLKEEISVLQLYYSKQINAPEAAKAITQPLSSCSTPCLGTYSDDSVGPAQLWRVIIDALAEWPFERVRDLIDLLLEIKKVNTTLYKGEIPGHEDKPLTWHAISFGGLWIEAYRRHADEVVAEAFNEAERTVALQNFIDRHQMEARLAEAGILEFYGTFIVIDSEMELNPYTSFMPSVNNDEKQLRRLWALQLDLEGLKVYMRIYGKILYTELGKVMAKQNSEDKNMESEERRMRDAWQKWKQRISEILQDQTVQDIHTQAKELLEAMENIERN